MRSRLEPLIIAGLNVKPPDDTLSPCPNESEPSEIGHGPAGPIALGWRPAILWLGLIGFAYGVLSVYLGQDNHFDNFLYHRYVPWAWLNERMDFDFAPAQVQTYFNPLTELPVYVLRERLSAKKSGFVLGGIHGLSTWLVMLISWICFHRLPKGQRALATLAATVFGALGVEAMDGVGRGTNDLLLSSLALAALYLVIYRGLSPGLGHWSLAGALLGFGVGLKMTLLAYAVGLGVLACLAPAEGVRTRIVRVVVTGLSGLAGVLTSGGWWMLKMYERFGSPVFPQANHIFRSPHYSTQEFETPGLGLHHGPLEYLLLPFRIAMDPQSVRTPGVDYRYAVCVVALMLVAAVWGWKRARGTGGPLLWTSMAPMVFFAAGFGAWEAGFGACVRYVVALDVMAGLVLMLSAQYLMQSLGGVGSERLRGFGLLIYLGLTILIWAQDVDRQGRRVDWRPRRFYDVKVLKDIDPGSVVLLADNVWAAYAIPNFRPDLRFAHVEGGYTFHTVGTPQGARLLRMLEGHNGTFYAIVRAHRFKTDPAYLRFFDGRFELMEDTCRRFSRRINPMFYFCQARQIAPIAGADARPHRLRTADG